MAKRWSLDEDEFLLAHFDTVGDWLGEHDLGRPKGAATARVRHLKKVGAWGALIDMQAAKDRYHETLGLLRFDDEVAA